MKNSSNTNTQRGLTLVEVVISVLLIAISIVSVLAAVTQSSVFSKRIDAVYTASYLAQRRIDILKEFEFDQLDPGAIETNVEIDVDDDGDSDYRRTTEITPNYSGNPKLTKIKVTVEKVQLNLDGTESGMGDPIIMETLLFEGFEEGS
jgi:type II secretory pathway pseudopilin PulG